MSLFSWLRSIVRPFNSAARSKPTCIAGRQLRLEVLEDRALLSVTSELFQVPPDDLSQVIPNVAGSMPIIQSTPVLSGYKSNSFSWLGSVGFKNG